MSFYAIYPAISGSGGGGGGITSINGDTTAAQVIAAGTGISVSSSGGTTTITNTGGGGSGTVTSVSVTTANGVSGTVATATTTPAISLTLGAITPSSINASGNITGNNIIGTINVAGGTVTSTGTIHAGGNIDGLNLSGTNTGDQTITLTGDVTGSGTGSFAATVAANAVTNAKLAQMPAHTFKGNNTAGTANALDLTQTQLTAELNQFTTTLQGVVPGSGGGSTNFLRADGTWAAPADTGITQLTGDVTAGPGSGSQASTIANLAVTNAKIANATIDLTTKVTGALPIANGGTGQVAAPAAFGALSPLTTKGDLLAFSTLNDRLPVGTNGQVLTADSGQALGVAWASASGSLPQFDVNIGDVSNLSVPTNLELLGAVSAKSGTSVVTISNATPGVITWTAHGLIRGDSIYFTTTGTLPSPLAPSTTYFVISATTNDFTVGLVPGESEVNTTTAGSGVHTAYAGGLDRSSNGFRYPFVLMDTPNGQGSTDVNTRLFTVQREPSNAWGTDISVTSTGANGTTFTIMIPGLYYMSYSDRNAVVADMGITKNFVGAPGGQNSSTTLVLSDISVGTTFNSVSSMAYLLAGDVIRAAVDNTGIWSSSASAQFRLFRIL